MEDDLTVNEAAHLLERSAEQVRYLIRTGRLAARKVGRQWRLRRQDVARAVIDGIPKPPAQQHDPAPLGIDEPRLLLYAGESSREPARGVVAG